MLIVLKIEKTKLRLDGLFCRVANVMNFFSENTVEAA